MKTKKKSGFSLVEIIIATTLFAVLAISASQMYINLSRMERKIEVQEYVAAEAKAAMEKITGKLQDSTINYTVDYEEYYSRLVLEDTDYGQNYGAYGATFYDPGDGGPIAIVWGEGGDGITGASCNADNEYFFTEDCEDFVLNSYDTNTGRHYYSDDVGLETKANAFCEGAVDCGDSENYFHDELYLIDSSGTQKVIFALEEKDNGEKVLSMVEMEGVDVDGDAITDYWRCDDDGYNCNTCSVPHYNPVIDGFEDYSVPCEDDLSDSDDIYADDFEPIMPSNLNVIDLSFYIAPLEDPYRAFSETNNAAQGHPYVIVTMVVAASESLTEGILGGDWTVTLTEEISTNVFDVVPSEYKGGWRWE